MSDAVIGHAPVDAHGYPRVFAATTDPWDHPRTTVGISLICDWAAHRGCATETLLSGTGISADALADAEHLIEAQQEIAVIRNLLHAFDDLPGMGVEIGRDHHLTAYGYYGYLLMTCSVVSDMVRLGLRYSPLTFAFSTIHGEFRPGDRWALTLRTDNVPDDIACFVIERDISASLQMQRELFAHPSADPLQEVHFEHEPPPPDAVARYRAIFGVPVLFGHDRTELIFDKDYLDWQLPMANEHTEAVMVDHCERIRAERVRSGGVAGRVRAHLMTLPTLDRTLDECAADLQYSSRTLRRCLTREGTSYREIHDDTRRSVAHDLLRDTSLPRTQIAERLGYRDWSSFTRAMRRWSDPHRPG
ncbi:AraC family transcriptional regulator [Williamsia limnetica]|uniref:AraC family transcriptional regulator n=1 Tax=Williamsia limnetica TaxID=882452 RepID=A0A318RJU7_WILLI|nr:AraC family transcriptional regulator [Williamsia limnetica]PYE15925.1 AraC family transcriptional regulator [Williamsia limnetica]